MGKIGLWESWVGKLFSLMCMYSVFDVFISSSTILRDSNPIIPWTRWRQQNNIKGARTDPIDPLLGSMMPEMMSRTDWLVGEVP